MKSSKSFHTDYVLDEDRSQSKSISWWNCQPFTLDVNYDSGCGTMAIPFSDLRPFFAQDPNAKLTPLSTNTASGPSNAGAVDLEVRVLSRDGKEELIPWDTTDVHVYESIRRRIFRGKLETNCFVSNHPHLQRLYVAHTKNQLQIRMPK